MNSKISMAFLVFSVCMLTKPQAQARIGFNIGLQPVWGIWIRQDRQLLFARY